MCLLGVLDETRQMTFETMTATTLIKYGGQSKKVQTSTNQIVSLQNLAMPVSSEAARAILETSELFFHGWYVAFDYDNLGRANPTRPTCNRTNVTVR